MCYAGLEALTAAHDSDTTQVLAIFDNEETGSQTKQGAGSPFLSYLLQRIALAQSGTAEAYYQAVERAFMISADNAHAFHPNYAEKYDPTNHPMLGGGPVIKFNAAQKYASDAVTAAVFAELCRKAGVPCQRFVNHSAARREAWPTTSIASRYLPHSTTNNPSSCTTISLSLPSSAHV